MVSRDNIKKYNIIEKMWCRLNKLLVINPLRIGSLNSVNVFSANKNIFNTFQPIITRHISVKRQRGKKMKKHKHRKRLKKKRHKNKP